MKNLLLLFILFISIVCCTKEPTPDTIPEMVNESSNWLGTTAQEYAGPQIVRLAWGHIRGEFTSVERFQELKEAGITHNFCSVNALEAANSAGIKVFLDSPEITNDPEGTAALYKNHPAIAGYFLGDEPTADKFPVYGAIADRIRAVDNVHYIYSNLLPIISYGTESYKAYVDEFMTVFKPDFVSYDFYAIYYRKDENELITDPQMFENLEIISDVAQKANKDFWAFCLSTSHRIVANGRFYPEPVLGTMRLYVYSDLAYGAQGIQYFTYWSPASSTSPILYGVEWLSSPISFEGAKGSTYNLLKLINTEIKNLSFVFADAKVKWVRHTGSSVPKGTTQLNTELGSTPFTKLQASGGLIVSLLEKGDNNYLVVVNRDPAKSIELIIETQTAVKRVLKSGAIIDSEGKLKITDGDAAIYTW